MLDLQTFTHAEYRTERDAFMPQAIGFSVNCPASVPEVIDPACFIHERVLRVLPAP